MTQKNKVFVLLLVLLTSMGSVQSFAGRRGKSSKAKTHHVHRARIAAPTTDDGDTYHGNEIHTGPRGGRYYINRNGNKTYIKH